MFIVVSAHIHVWSPSQLRNHEPSIVTDEYNHVPHDMVFKPNSDKSILAVAEKYVSDSSPRCTDPLLIGLRWDLQECQHSLIYRVWPLWRLETLQTARKDIQHASYRGVNHVGTWMHQ